MLYDDLVQPGEYICHYGVKNMKWGVRRYQNPDGSLTAAGRKKYLSDNNVSLNDKALKRSKIFKNLNLNINGYGNKTADNIIKQYNLHTHKIPAEKMTELSKLYNKSKKLNREYRSKENSLWNQVYKDFYGVDYNGNETTLNFNRDDVWKEVDRRFKKTYPKLYNNWNDHKNDFFNAVRQYTDDLVRSTIPSNLYNARTINNNLGYLNIGRIITGQLTPNLMYQVKQHNLN